MRFTPLAVALALLLAGCSGFVGGGGEPSPTITPASPQEVNAYPPGIDATGVVSPVTLAAAHDSQDDDVSYTLVSNRTVRYPNGTVRSAIYVRIALAENRSYLTTVSTNGSEGPVLLGRPPATATFWSNGDTYARELTRDGATSYNTFDPPDQYTGTWRFWTRTVAFGGRSGYAEQTVQQAFSAIPTTLVGEETRDGVTLYRLTGDEAESTVFTAPEIDTVSNLTFDAVVDQRGLVRRMHYRFDGRIDGTAVTVERTIAYEDVGNTTVGKPAWLERARDDPQ